MSARPPYHAHADLRAALIAAGMDILAREGLAGLTLRRVAAAAGVSHAAPAHHFDGLPGLMTALAAQSYGLFADIMAAHQALSQPDALGRISGLCAGYLAFAVRHPALFQVMFTSPLVRRDDPDVVAAAARAYGLLRAACAPFGGQDTPDVALEHAVFSLVHGYAMLGFGSQAAQGSPRQTAVPFDHHLRRLLGLPGP